MPGRQRRTLPEEGRDATQADSYRDLAVRNTYGRRPVPRGAPRAGGGSYPAARCGGSRGWRGGRGHAPARHLDLRTRGGRRRGALLRRGGMALPRAVRPRPLWPPGRFGSIPPAALPATRAPRPARSRSSGDPVEVDPKASSPRRYQGAPNYDEQYRAGRAQDFAEVYLRLTSVWRYVRSRGWGAPSTDGAARRRSVPATLWVARPAGLVEAIPCGGGAPPARPGIWIGRGARCRWFDLRRRGRWVDRRSARHRADHPRSWRTCPLDVPRSRTERGAGTGQGREAATTACFQWRAAASPLAARARLRTGPAQAPGSGKPYRPTDSAQRRIA
jgi:hypothetical protein